MVGLVLNVCLYNMVFDCLLKVKMIERVFILFIEM